MKIVNTVETFNRQQILAKHIADDLKTTNIKTPHFYITPKVHKKDIPGRPVVSSSDCHNSKFSKFVDHYLQLHAKALPSYVKDTTDFINILGNVKDISKDSILVILDVIELYTNISNHEGIETVNEALSNQAKIFIKFLYLTLTLNNYVFKSTMSKRKTELWAQFAHQHMQTFS